MGKRTLDSIYLKLGVTEMDDMAEGIKALWNRPYFDKTRTGIYDTPTAATRRLGRLSGTRMCFRLLRLLRRRPRGITTTLFTLSRYMRIPEGNKEGYEAGSAMNFAKDLRGRLPL